MTRPVLRIQDGSRLMRKRLDRGVPWVFNNEVANLKFLRRSANVGLCDVRDSDGRELGVALFNPFEKVSPVVAHMMSDNIRAELDFDFFHMRVARAIRHRRKNFRAPFCRLVHGEGDELPGLFVDQFDDILVATLAHPGLVDSAQTILDVLGEACSCQFVILQRKDQPGCRGSSPRHNLTHEFFVRRPECSPDERSFVPASSQDFARCGAVRLDDGRVCVRRVIVEGGVSYFADILRWDFSLRGLRDFCHKRKSHFEVLGQGQSRFFGSQARFCRVGAEGQNTGNVCDESPIFGAVIDVSSSVGSHGGKHTKQGFRQGLTGLIEARLVSDYSWFLFCIHDRVKNGELRELFGDKYVVERDIACDVDFPTNLSIPKSREIRGCVYKKVS